MNNKEYDQHIINFHTQLLVSMLSTGKVVDYLLNEKSIGVSVSMFAKSFNENIAKTFLNEKKEQIKNIDDFNQYPEQFLIHCKHDMRKMKEEFLEKKSKKLFSQFYTLENNLEEINNNKAKIKPDILTVAINDIKGNTQTIIKEIAQLFKEVVIHFKNDEINEKENALYVVATNVAGIYSKNQHLKNLKEVFNTTMERILEADLLENCNINNNNKTDYNKEDYNKIFTIMNVAFEKLEPNKQRNGM